MPHISRKKLKGKILPQMHQKLVKTFSSIENQAMAEAVVGQLLTPTERVMLGKRIVMVHLISEGVSPYTIQKLLSVSSSTVAKFQNRYEQGAFDKIAKKYQRPKERMDFEQIIDRLLTISAAKYSRTSRARWLNNFEDSYRKYL